MCAENINATKHNFSGVADVHVEFRIVWDALKNIDTDITTFFQYSGRDNNSSINYNEASDADYDSNSDYKPLYLYVLYEKYPWMIERDKHNNNKDNGILDDDDIKNFQ